MGRWVPQLTCLFFSHTVVELYSSHTQVNPQAFCIVAALHLLHIPRALLLLLLLFSMPCELPCVQCCLGANFKTMHVDALVTLSS